MSTETKRDRSPNHPKMPLSQALDIASILHKKAGKSLIRPEVAVSALGYSSLNGAALTTIGALSQYGLLDRSRADGIAVSKLALSLLHPVNDAQSIAARRESVLKPKVFSELFTGGFHHASEDVLTNHLIQLGFTHDGARKAASVFKANVEFANLSGYDDKHQDEMNLTPTEMSRETAQQPRVQHLMGQFVNPKPLRQPPDTLAPPPMLPVRLTEKTLAKYSVPLGGNVATILFEGDELHVEDFDALKDYVDLFKKQFERTSKIKPAPDISKQLEEAAGMGGVDTIGDP
jgi:hypothetical protein